MNELTADVKGHSSMEGCLLCYCAASQRKVTEIQGTTGIEVPTEVEDDHIGCL